LILVGRSGFFWYNNLMSDDQKTTGTDEKKVEVIIPEEVKEKYPELIPQIMASESMDDEERNYWFSVLPIMTDEQVAELRDILESERKRAEKRAKNENLDLDEIEKKRKEALAQRRQKEQYARSEDHEQAEDLLSELEGL
jgi:hypothetical protein